MTDLMETSAVARKFSVTYQTIRNWCKSGILEQKLTGGGLKVYRIMVTRASVEKRERELSNGR